MIRLEDLSSRRAKVAVVGLGYVGLPLAVALSKHVEVLGFDISTRRVEELSGGFDRTGEVEAQTLAAHAVDYTADPTRLREAHVVIVAVPTPIDKHLSPDLTPIMGATNLVGEHLAQGAVVVYESTVYPGLTEEICVPILENRSGMRFCVDFTVGYSPERINPGDKVHTLATIVKIVAGSDTATLELLAGLYGLVVTAGVHKASSIKVAEAAKVIENTQRDLNIALMNELALIFERMGVDTLEVLEAAGTKWNFLPFRPGLVGGHCIGVDPYYLTYKAESLGHHPEVILAGRRINDSMARHVAHTCVKLMIKNGCTVCDAKVGIMGLTFKENVPDLRNTKVIDLVHELTDYGIEVLVHDPLADPEEAKEEYDLTLAPLEAFTNLSALVIAVPHKAYGELRIDDLAGRFADPDKGVLMDVKGAAAPASAERPGPTYWRL